MFDDLRYDSPPAPQGVRLVSGKSDESGCVGNVVTALLAFVLIAALARWIDHTNHRIDRLEKAAGTHEQAK